MNLNFVPRGKLLLFILSLNLVLFLPFQNCSKISFRDLNSKITGDSLTNTYNEKLPACSALEATGITQDQSCNCSSEDIETAVSRTVVGSFLYNMQKSGICAAAKHVGIINDTQRISINLKVGLPCQYFYGQVRNGITSASDTSTSPVSTFYFRDNDNVCSATPISNEDVTCLSGTLTWVGADGSNCSGSITEHTGASNFITTAILDNDNSDNSAVGSAYFKCEKIEGSSSAGNWMPVTGIPGYAPACSLIPPAPLCNPNYDNGSFADTSQFYGRNLCANGIAIGEQVVVTATGWSWACQGQGAKSDLVVSCLAAKTLVLCAAPAGSYCTSGMTTALTCPAGSYCTGGTAAPIACAIPTACPAGTTTAPLSLPATCTAPAGSYCISGTTTTTTCPAGSYCTGGTGQPIACTPASACTGGNSTQPIAAYTYSWYQSGWGSCSPTTAWTYSTTTGCSATCGGGSQNVVYTCSPSGTHIQTVECRRSDNTTVNDSYCASSSKPATSESCATSSCTGSDQTHSQSCNNQICPGNQKFTTSGVFVVPPGVTSVNVTVTGGGGGGGSAIFCSHANGDGFSISQCGGGGGCGGQVTTTRVSVPASNTIAITIGAGGKGGTAVNIVHNQLSSVNGVSGTSGSTSSFGTVGSPYYVSASGGGSGSGAMLSPGAVGQGCPSAGVGAPGTNGKFSGIQSGSTGYASGGSPNGGEGGQISWSPDPIWTHPSGIDGGNGSVEISWP